MDFGIYAGDTSKTTYFRFRDSTTGLAKTGLVFNSAGASAYYTLPGAAAVAITLATQTVAGAWSSGGFVEVDATNAKGLYRFDPPNAAIATGDFTVISIEFDGIIEESMEVPLHTRKVNTIEVSGTTQTAGDLAALIGAIGVSTGGAKNFAMDTDNTGGAIKSISFVGVETSGTFASTEADDGTYHQIDDTTNAIDIVYGATIDGSRTAVEIYFSGYLSGSNDSIDVQLYDFVGADWETRYVLTGQSGTTNVTKPIRALGKHTGTGADIGKVYVRFVATGQSNPTLRVDELLVAGVFANQTVGYANGAVWINTLNGTAGTEPFVNGTVDKPVLTLADAITIAASIGLTSFEVSPGSTIIFAETHNNELWGGHGWTLELGTQDVDGCHFFNCSVSGVGTAATEMEYHNCEIGTASLQNTHCYECSFDGTVTMTLAGNYNYINCESSVAGASSPTFTKTAGQTITAQWRNWKGGVTQTVLEASDVLTIGGGELGTVTLSGSGGMVELRGIYKASSTGGYSGTLNIDGAILAADVAAILVDTGTTIPATIVTVQDDLDIITGSDGVTLATAQALYAPNVVVPDAAGTAATLHAATDGLITTVDTVLDALVVTVGVAGVGLTDLGGMSTTMKAQVNTEVLDVLSVDTFTQPGQETPAATTTIVTMLGYSYKAWRNKKTQTATEYNLYNDDASTVDQQQTMSDDSTTLTVGEITTGP